MNRREFLPATALGAAVANTSMSASQGRIKQSVCRWCYRNVSTEDLAKESARLGTHAIDLLDEKEWGVAENHGLGRPSVSCANTIPDGFPGLKNHDEIEGSINDC